LCLALCPAIFAQEEAEQAGTSTGAGQPVQAEPVAAGDEEGPALEEELKWLQAENLVIGIPTVVGASRFEQQSVKAPASVSVVTRDQIKKYGYRTLAEILRSLRSFMFTNDRVLTLLGVRGSNSLANLNTQFLVLIDGHRINDNLYDYGFIDMSFPLDIDLIERVEVVRGPVSCLYGSNAFLAVVNVITRKPRSVGKAEDRALGGGEVSGATGTFNTYKGRFTYANQIADEIGVMLSGTYAETRGDRYYYGEFDHPSTNYGHSTHDYEQDEYLYAKVLYRQFTLSALYSKRDKHDPMATFTVFNDKTSNTVDRRFAFDLKYEDTFGDDWDFSTRAFYDHYQYKWVGTYEWEGAHIMNVSDPTGAWWGVETLLTKPILEDHTVTTGFEFRRNVRIDHFAYDIEPYFEYADVEEENDVTALFVQDQYEVLDNLILNAGIRYDRYSSFGETLNPRAALIYNPLPKTVLKLLYGQAFRPPNSYELYYTDGMFLFGNSDLDPETIRTYEAILEQYLGRNYRVILTGFRNEIRDTIVSVPHPTVADATTYQNGDILRSHGAELELEAEWENGVQGRVSYSYQEAEHKPTRSRLVNSPRQMAKFNLIFPIIKDKVFCGPEAIFIGSRKTYSGNTAHSYWLTNFTLFSQNILPGLEMSVSIYNVLNKRYTDVASQDHPQDEVRHDGRAALLKLTYAF